MGNNNPMEKELDRLYKDFVEINKRRNILRISEFLPYTPLFKKYSKEEYEQKEDYLFELANSYRTKVNVYEPVKIVDDNDINKVIMILPPVFMPLKPVDFEKYKELYQTSGRLAIERLPKKQAEIMLNVLDALFLSQDNDQLVDYAIKAFAMKEIAETLINETKNIEKNIETSSTSDNIIVEEDKISDKNDDTIDFLIEE